jgi:hypothetical protein
MRRRLFQLKCTVQQAGSPLKAGAGGRLGGFVGALCLRLAGAIILLVFAAERPASAADGIRLEADAIGVLDSFVEAVAAAEQWKLTSYPATAWRDLAKIIADGIEADVSILGWPAVRDRLFREGFARYVEAENARLSRTICPSTSDCRFDETIGAIRDGNEFRVIDTILNMRRVLVVVDARLRLAAANWRYGRWALFNRTGAADIESAVLAALVERQETLRALHVAEAIAALPSAMRRNLGVDVDAISAQIAAIGGEAGKEAFALLGEVETAEDAAVRSALTRAESGRAAAVDHERALVAAVTPVYAVAERLGRRIESASDALNDYLCMRDLVPLSHQRDQSETTPYLALQRAIGDPSNSAKLVLVAPLGTLGEGAMAAMSATMSRSGLDCPDRQGWSSAVIVELGAVVPALAYDLEERAFFIRAGLGRRWEYAKQSAEEQRADLLAALDQLGLPALGPVRNIELQIEHLFDDVRRRVVVSFVAVQTVPGLGAVQTPISIDLADGAALTVNTCPLKRAAGQAIASRLEAAFVDNGRAALLDRSGAAALADLSASGGADCGAVVRVDGAITVGALNATVPVSLTLDADGRLTPSGRLFVAPLKDSLRAEVVRRIIALVASVNDDVEGLDSFARVTALEVDADRLLYQGVFSASGNVDFRFGDGAPVRSRSHGVPTGW